MKSEPYLIAPDSIGGGDYSYKVITNKKGAVIKGIFEFLNMAGTRIVKGPLEAEIGPLTTDKQFYQHC